MELIPSALANYTLESYLTKVTTRSKVIYWIIILTIVTGLAILPFIYVDVSVQARGYFQSDIERQIVYTPLQGKIVHISIRNGDRVLKGDTLLVLDSETIRAQQEALIQRITENNASVKDLEKLTGMDSSDLRKVQSLLVTKKYMADIASIRNQHTMQAQKYKKKKAEHERNELLISQRIIPEIEFENTLFMVNSEKANLNQILVYQKSVWQNDLTQRRNEAINLAADLEQCHENLTNRIILAPVSGEIIQSSDIQKGSIVSPGQKIAEISPDGELVATCFVKPADIGLVTGSQPVKIQVDAFNYHEWGMLTATIDNISDDMIVEDGSQACFRIKCKPDKTFLTLKNGHKAYIKKGMSLNARIIVIRRSLSGLLFDKANKWFNPYTYKKE